MELVDGLAKKHTFYMISLATFPYQDLIELSNCRQLNLGESYRNMQNFMKSLIDILNVKGKRRQAKKKEKAKKKKNNRKFKDFITQGAPARESHTRRYH